MATTKKTSARGGTKSVTARRKATTAKRSTSQARTRATEAARQAPSQASRQEVSCNVPFCPICTVVTTTQHMQPEILGHLIAAAREVTLAARAMVDNRADEVAPTTRLQRIDLA